jgi:glycosyltransferase involved in cell wall biosynthesis
MNMVRMLRSDQAALAPAPEVSIVCPMYNESAGIAGNLDRLLERLKDLKDTWELIIVNDGSRDNSAAIVEPFTAREPRLILLSYDRNRGRGYALRTGFAHARGRIVVTTESDLSWGPDIVEKLVAGLRDQDVDMVVASPYLPGGRLENVPARRVFLSHYGNKILSRATESRVTMLSGMTRAYRREVIDSLYLHSDGKEIHLEIISQAEAMGFRIGEIPAVLAWEPPKPGVAKRKSNFNARKYIFSHLMFTFSEAPFLLMGTAGTIAIGLSGLLILYLAYDSIFLDINAGGRPLLIIAALLGISGVQVLLFSFNAGQVVELRKMTIHMRNRMLRDSKPRSDDPPAEKTPDA